MEKKENYLISKNKIKCTGCGACKNICPKNAITMKEDVEGFYYPEIDKTKCINCHLCERTCSINKISKNIKPQVYYYITKNEKKLLNASSGGAFIDIINSFYEKNNTIVYGCIFNENNKAIHVGYENKNDMVNFCKSKYVQSDTKDCFKEVKKNLLQNKKVLFSGTPCQVSGLKSFLNKEYENLLLVDIICHGVPSQKLLDYYIYNEEKKFKSKIKSINFREKVKDKNGHYNSRNVKLCFKNGKEIIQSISQSSYLCGFHNRLFYRPSCYECQFSNINRESDITIADAWGIENVDKNLDANKGVSIIIINSSKGEKYLKNMLDETKKLPIKFVIDYNKSYTMPTKIHKNRKKFFQGLNINNYNKKIKKYSKLRFTEKIYNKIKILIKKYKILEFK